MTVREVVLRADIILTTPPFSLKENFGPLDFVGQYGPPMNLLYLASSLEKNGIKVKLIDFSCERKSLEDCAKYIISLDPEFVGIAVHFTFLVNKALKLAALIKSLDPEIRIIAGGVHFTALPEETMRECPYIDVGILGEAEESLSEVIKCLRNGDSLKGVNGIIFRDGKELFKSGKAGFIENIDKLPFPRFAMADMSSYSLSLYKEKRRTNLSIITSRGCPFACNFCDRTVLGEKVRFLNADYLSELIDNLVLEFNVDYLDIEDENICITKDRFLEICGILRQKFHKHNITWGCSMRADTVEPQTGRILYDSGCRSVAFGIESGSKKMLNVYNKRLNLDMLPEKCRIITDSGITLGGSFIIGGPGEDKKSILDTVNLIKKIDLSFMYLWYFAPFPGSAICKGIEKKGKLLGDYSRRTGQHVSFIPVTLSMNELESGYRQIYRSFYSKPSVIAGVLKKYGWRGAFRFCKNGINYLQRFILNDIYKLN